MTSRPLNHGTRYEIAVGGQPRTYRDVRAIAIAAALSSRGIQMPT
jgi:hypothetical protein